MVMSIEASLSALRRDQSAATSIEYALIAVFISILVVGWATFVGTAVSDFFMAVGNGF